MIFSVHRQPNLAHKRQKSHLLPLRCEMLALNLALCAREKLGEDNNCGIKKAEQIAGGLLTERKRKREREREGGGGGGARGRRTD